MTAKLWFIVLGFSAAIGFVDGIGQALITFGLPSYINSSLTYQVDQVGSGSGFLSIIRTSGDFLIYFVPNLVTFNWALLSGYLEPVRALGQFVVGGLVIITLGQAALGLLQRNV